VFIEAKDDGDGGDNWTTGAIGRAKLQSNLVDWGAVCLLAATVGPIVR